MESKLLDAERIKSSPKITEVQCHAEEVERVGSRSATPEWQRSYNKGKCSEQEVA
jgi:hypothetical protein